MDSMETKKKLTTDIESSEAIASSVIENNLTAFKQYLDDPDSF